MYRIMKAAIKITLVTRCEPTIINIYPKYIRLAILSSQTLRRCCRFPNLESIPPLHSSWMFKALGNVINALSSSGSSTRCVCGNHDMYTLIMIRTCRLHIPCVVCLVYCVIIIIIIIIIMVSPWSSPSAAATEHCCYNRYANMLSSGFRGDVPIENEFFEMWFHNVPHGFICLIYKSLTFQAQGIRSIPRFQADQSSAGLAFKSGEWWACKAIDAIANQTDSSNFLPKKMHGEFQGGLRLSRIQPKQRRKASVEMRCAPWLRRSVSCLRARFHCPALKKHTKRDSESFIVVSWGMTWECYFGKEGSLQDSLSHFEMFDISVKFVSGFWFVKCEIVKQFETVGWTIVTLADLATQHDLLNSTAGDTCHSPPAFWHH